MLTSGGRGCSIMFILKKKPSCHAWPVTSPKFLGTGLFLANNAGILRVRGPYPRILVSSPSVAIQLYRSGIHWTKRWKMI